MSEEMWARRIARERAAREAAEQLLEEKSRELYRANLALHGRLRDITALIDGAPHSILTIEPDLSIGGRFSKALIELFQRPSEEIAGAPAAPFLSAALELRGDRAATFAEAVSAIIGAETLNWDLNQQHLPTEARVEGPPSRILELFWTPMVDFEMDVTTALLVSIRDVTAERSMAKRIAAFNEEQAQFLSALDQLLKAPRDFLGNFFHETESRIEHLETTLAQERINADELLIHAHTLKGAARAVGFAQIADELHDFEEFVLAHPIRKNQDVRAQWTKAKAAYLPLKKAYSEILEGRASLAPRIGALAAPPLEAGRGALTSCGLELRYVFDVGIGPLSESQASGLGTAFLHLIANMIDHSLTRQPPADGIAELTISANYLSTTEASRSIEVTLEDNGGGFDHAAIAARAAERGIEQDPQDPLAIVFEPQFSTTEVTSLSAGRGVGMSAALQSIERIGGTITLGNRADGGSRIIICIPAH